MVWINKTSLCMSLASLGPWAIVVFGPVFRRVLVRKEHALKKAARWLSRSGLWVVAIAEVSSIPLTQVAWAAGLLRMNFAIFVAE